MTVTTTPTETCTCSECLSGLSTSRLGRNSSGFLEHWTAPPGSRKCAGEFSFNILVSFKTRNFFWSSSDTFPFQVQLAELQFWEVWTPTRAAPTGTTSALSNQSKIYHSFCYLLLFHLHSFPGWAERRNWKSSRLQKLPWLSLNSQSVWLQKCHDSWEDHHLDTRQTNGHVLNSFIN